MQRAFSLVELSIVLVILGLLVGGILAGQSLIRAAELRAVGTEYQRYMTAIHAFRDKYLAYPGDMANATSIWGKDTTYCNGQSGTASATGTCNGDGNSLIAAATAPSQTGEMFQFWRQLQLAGLVEGVFSGVAGAGSTSESFIRQNVPASRLPGAGWSVSNMGYYPGTTVVYAYTYGNTFTFGGDGGGNTTYMPNVLRAEEAWNIDTKIDDGKPGSGKVFVRSWNAWGVNSCSTATSQTDYTGSYNLSLPSKLCGFLFPQLF